MAGSQRRTAPRRQGRLGPAGQRQVRRAGTGGRPGGPGVGQPQRRDSRRQRRGSGQRAGSGDPGAGAPGRPDRERQPQARARRQTVELQRAPPWQRLHPGQAASEVIRSLACVGPAGSEATLGQIRAQAACLRAAGRRQHACTPARLAGKPRQRPRDLCPSTSSCRVTTNAKRSSSRRAPGSPVAPAQEGHRGRLGAAPLFTGPHAQHLVSSGGTSLPRTCARCSDSSRTDRLGSRPVH